MTDDVTFIAGCLLISVICAWAVWHLTGELRLKVQSGTAVDRTLSAFDKKDAPGMFLVQIVGYVLLIGASAMIGIGAMAALIKRLVSGT
jgi:hypothetical protein